MKTFLMFVLIFTAIAAKADAADTSVDCDKPVTTTLDINYCEWRKLEAYEDRMEAYLKKIREHHKREKKALRLLKESQVQWSEYRDQYCDALLELLHDATVRTSVHIACQQRIVKQRTHDLWSDFLTYMDDTAPVLPEPEQ